MQASPSKARAEALESHSWSVVLTWFASLYHPSPPPSFERNASTLKALQRLMAENVAVETGRDLLLAAQTEELAARDGERGQGRAQDRTNDENNGSDLLGRLESSLSRSSNDALDAIARSAVLLGCPLSSRLDGSSSIMQSMQSMQSQILNLPLQTFALETQISSINDLIGDLETEITQIRQCLPTTLDPDQAAVSPDVGSNSLSISIPPPSSPFPASTTTDHSTLHAETQQHQRETKQLALKAAEYQDRISTLERQAKASSQNSNSNSNSNSSNPVYTPATLGAKQASIDHKRKQVAALEKQLVAFHGLPPDLAAARAEVQRAEKELEELRRRRDELFETMGV